jgi:tetratricopeptide (TPR) repeat protein
MKTYKLLTLIFFSLFALSGFSQTIATTTLSPEAQAAINKGITAAKLPDYLLAIRYFEDARKIAPGAPEIFFNLGLAESKIPGRELRAICWFGAYLAAEPSATNAAAVKEQIDVLDMKSQSNLSHLIKSVQDVVSQTGSYYQEHHMGQVAGLWAEAGDMPTALKTAGQIQDVYHKNQSWAAIAKGQMKAGDIAGALKTVDMIRPSDFNRPADFQSNTVGALADLKTVALRDIARAQQNAGNIAGTQTTLMYAATNAALIQNADLRVTEQGAIADDQAKAGDIDGAKNTLASVQYTGNELPMIGIAREELAVAQARAGDISGAQQTADLILWPEGKKMAQDAINLAKKYATPTQQKASVGPVINIVKVSDWVYKLDDQSAYNDCALNTDPFLDLASYLTSQHSDDPETLFYNINVTAEKIATAQNIIDKMLKQQSKP